MFKSLSPNLMVEDVERTLAFYETVLGFSREMILPEQAPFDWALVRRDQVYLMFQARNSVASELPEFQARPVGGSFSLYIEVEQVDALYEALRHQTAVVTQLHNTFYQMREFTIADPNGYILTFAEPVPAVAPA